MGVGEMYVTQGVVRFKYESSDRGVNYLRYDLHI